jgi:hypothetical protein
MRIKVRVVAPLLYLQADKSKSGCSLALSTSGYKEEWLLPCFIYKRIKGRMVAPLLYLQADKRKSGCSLALSTSG